MNEVRAVGIPWFRREDWDALINIFEDGDRLHATYDEWRNAAGNLEGRLRSQGHIVERVHIDPNTFPDWCRTRGLNIDAKARTWFANEVAFERHKHAN